MIDYEEIENRLEVLESVVEDILEYLSLAANPCGVPMNPKAERRRWVSREGPLSGWASALPWGYL